MKPGKKNYIIQQGADFKKGFYAKINGEYVSFTGATVYAQVKQYQSRSAALIATFVTALEDLVIDGTTYTDSKITFSLDDTITAALNPGSYYYDILVVDSAGNDDYYLYGDIIVEARGTVK